MLWIGITIGVVVVIVIIVALAALSAVATTVTVSAVNITSGDNACGANGNTESGFTMAGGGAIQDTIVIHGGFLLSCTINSVSATTSGFSVSGANTPLTVPADGSQSLSFTIHAPNSSYNGVLTLDLE